MTYAIGSDGKAYKRYLETEVLDKYALFTTDDYYAIRERIASVNDVNELAEIIHILKEAQHDVVEVLIDTEHKVKELMKNNTD